MPEYKCSFIFSFHKQGWSETYYLSESNADLAMSQMKALGPSRSKLLGNGADIEAIRVVEADKPRGGLLEDVSGQWPGYDAKADTPWNAIMVSAVVAGHGKRCIWLRGCPDSWIDLKEENGKNILPAVARGLINAFIEAAITTVRVRMKVLTQTAQNVTPLDITGLAAAANGNLSLTVTGSTAAVGELIGMKKWKGPDAKLLNRRYTVTANTGTTVTIRLPFVNLSAPTLDAGGKLYTKKTEYAYISSMKIQRPAKKSTGRAFFVPRGRQPKKVC